MQVKGGYRSPEDLRKTLFNSAPTPQQLQPDDRVDRIRRIQLSELENLPFFLVVGLMYTLTGPPLLLARVLLCGYVASRYLHFAAHLGGGDHETRAVFWTIGSLIVIFMTVRTLLAALGY